MPIKLYAHNRQAYKQAAAMMAQIQPDYIILDEFHRCSAQVRGAGNDLGKDGSVDGEIPTGEVLL